MLEIIIAGAVGLFMGWLTKVPWLHKWYKEFEKEKKVNARMRVYLAGKEIKCSSEEAEEGTEVQQIRLAIKEYRTALNNHQHGGMAANDCLTRIQEILSMRWNR